MGFTFCNRPKRSQLIISKLANWTRTINHIHLILDSVDSRIQNMTHFAHWYPNTSYISVVNIPVRSRDPRSELNLIIDWNRQPWFWRIFDHEKETINDIGNTKAYIELVNCLINNADELNIVCILPYAVSCKLIKVWVRTSLLRVWKFRKEKNIIQLNWMSLHAIKPLLQCYHDSFIPFPNIHLPRGMLHV